MKILLLLSVFLIGACQKPSAEEAMFYHEGEKRTESDPEPLFFADAFSRLKPEERQHFKQLGKTAGLLIAGEKYTCMAIVTLREDVINHASTPMFCYDKKTNDFVQRL